MISKTLLTSIFLSFLLTLNAFSAGSSDSGSSKTKTQYDMAVTHIKAAKNFEKKDKLEKAKKRYEKAQKLLIQSNKKFPNKADTLN